MYRLFKDMENARHYFSLTSQTLFFSGSYDRLNTNPFEKFKYIIVEGAPSLPLMNVQASFEIEYQREMYITSSGIHLAAAHTLPS